LNFFFTSAFYPKEISMTNLLEEITEMQTAELATARAQYRDILNRELAGGSRKGDADSLAKVLDVLGLSVDAMSTERRALAEYRELEARYAPADAEQKIADTLATMAADAAELRHLREVKHRAEIEAATNKVRLSHRAWMSAKEKRDADSGKLLSLRAELTRVLGE
jgi:uncharacterized membrane protein YccC